MDSRLIVPEVSSIIVDRRTYWEKADQADQYELTYAIPYSDLESLSLKVKQKYIKNKTVFEFGHSLTAQIQGQLDAGFVLTGFYEDKGGDLLDKFTDTFIATRALKKD